MELTKVLALPDIHLPAEDKLTMMAVEAYMADLQPDEIVYMGDLLDLNCISAHNLGNLRAVESTRLLKDFDAANVMLDRHEALTPETKRRTYIEGNHEHRAARWVDANPQMEGIIDIPKNLRLEERGIKYVRSWSKGEVHRVGKAALIHGIYTSSNHAKNHVEAYGENVFYGHVHDIQSHSKTMNGDNKTIIGQSIGCLCDYKQDYMKGHPNKWQQAFAVFNIFPDGFFNAYVVSIFKHRFVSPEGWVYDGKEIRKGAKAA